MPLLVRYATILMFVSGKELLAFAYETKGSDGKINIWNSSNSIQRHLYPHQDSHIVQCSIGMYFYEWNTCSFLQFIYSIFMLFYVSKHVCHGEDEDHHNVDVGCFVVVFFAVFVITAIHLSIKYIKMLLKEAQEMFAIICVDFLAKASNWVSYQCRCTKSCKNMLFCEHIYPWYWTEGWLLYMNKQVKIYWYMFRISNL